MDGTVNVPDAVVTPDGTVATPDATVTPDAMVGEDATTTMDATVPDMNVPDGTVMMANCTYDDQNGIQGMGCLPRCSNAIVPTIQACMDQTCVDAALASDTTPPVDITIDNQTGALTCGGCWQLQVGACQNQSCQTQIDAFLTCSTTNGCMPGAACPACDTQLMTAQTCLTTNETTIQTCADTLLSACFGTTAMPGCSASFASGIAGDDCTPRCSAATTTTVNACPADDPATMNNEALDCINAALGADTTPGAMVDGLNGPLDCEGCWDVSIQLCVGNSCPTEFENLFNTCSTANNCGAAADFGACLMQNCAAEITAYDTCTTTNETAINDCFGQRVPVCFQ